MSLNDRDPSSDTDPEYLAELDKARRAVAEETQARRWGGHIGWLITVVSLIAGAIAIADQTHSGALVFYAMFGLLLGVLLILGNRWTGRR